MSPTARYGAGTVTVERLSSLAEIEALGGPWRELHERLACPSVFTELEWVAPWYRCYGAGGDPLVLVAHDGPHRVGIAPLHRWTGTLAGVPVRRIDLAGHNFSVPDLLVPGGRADVAAAFLDHLWDHRSGWDVVVLKGPSRESGTLEVLVERLRAGGRPHAVLPLRVPAVELTGTWESYLSAKGANLRKQLARAERRALAVGAVGLEVERAIPAERLDPLMGRILAIGLKSWKGRAGTAIASSPHVADFYRRVVRGFNRDGRLELALLTLGGRDAAYMLSLARGRDYYEIDTAYDEAYRDASPGTLLNLLLIRDLHERGFRRCIAEGDHDYKSRWATGHLDASEIYVFSGSLRGRLAREMRFGVLPALAARLRRETHAGPTRAAGGRGRP